MSSSDEKTGDPPATSKEDLTTSLEENEEDSTTNEEVLNEKQVGVQRSYLTTSKDDDQDGRENMVVSRRKLRSKIIKTKYVNVLAHKYYTKKHLWFIFLPIQLLSVWTTISGAVFALDIFKPDGTDSTDTPRRSLIDALVGASLLILTNLSNILQFDAKSKQHNLVSAQMDNLIELVDFLVVGKEGTDEYRDSIKEIENNFKVTISNDKLSPPSEIKLAFDILQSRLELEILQKKSKDEEIKTADGKSRNNVTTNGDAMGDYSLLACFIESRITLCTMLPNSRESAKVIDDIMDDRKINSSIIKNNRFCNFCCKSAKVIDDITGDGKMYSSTNV